MKLGKYSFGIGDRFAREGEAQLRAILKAQKAGIDISPVWNKSNREHTIVHSKPEDTRKEADAAVSSLGYKGPYFVDADHVGLGNVEGFLESSNFFTLDVAAFIGKPSSADDVADFLDACEKYKGEWQIPGIDSPFEVDDIFLKEMGDRFLAAVTEAGNIYRAIKARKGATNFITEVSMDEVEAPQTPIEMFFILKMIADEGIPVQTIAPKFTGRFNKGVDYLGDVKQFAREFEEDILVIDFAVKEFGLPDTLKLSVHSGSDKFSIYPVMAEIIRKYDKGLHIKTAGTTWIEEMIGLALADGEALELAKNIYKKALERKDELCAPYADVIDINEQLLPSASEVDSWGSRQFANALRHIPGHPEYNPDFRQLIHVGYKVAAEYGETYTGLVERYKELVGRCVEENLFERHLKRLFNL
ncbi:tagaturonate epimerase family protein [Prolixibacter sp. SD074]|uniref:tagaturonate epimerase family protein n=1 Tax=Prolixibacter sp. SD074 TaxID=2652391 RepID=UPI00128A01F2|nr:tagaturonate epimerase family protein [Prolixibacter sp. SD074]GET29780.1 hypothetical protein SD074_19820 [Prolixibacter sp. SD074]